MPSYRTTSLFHYTKTANNLFNILKSGKLIPNYCKEDLSVWTGPEYIWGIPMICFCDIPILSAGDFLKNYGRYCIAFDKRWGVRKGCNPIQYVSNDKIIGSLIYLILRIEQLQEYELIFGQESDFDKRGLYEIAFSNGLFDLHLTERLYEELDDENNPLWKAAKTFRDNISKKYPNVINIYRRTLISHLSSDNKSKLYFLGYLKKYLGEWQGKPYLNYKENEWRYIVEETDSVKWLNKEEYLEWRGNKEIQIHKPKPTEALIKESLKFSVSDINHIILNKESQIPSFIRRIRKLEKIGDTTLDEYTKDILISKISSFERIKKDY